MIRQRRTHDGHIPGANELRGTVRSAARGRAAEPDVVIRTPGRVWLAIARRELDGQQAFMSGQYQAEGDIGRLIKLGELFQ